MKKYRLFTITFALTLHSLALLAQGPKQDAVQKCKDAIKLEDDGKFDAALKLLTEAQKLDANNINIPYEIAYCYYAGQEYQKVVDVLDKLKDRPDSFDRLYQLLGNSYDNLKLSNKAVTTYDEGLKRFPNSGCLYLEKGVIPLDEKNYTQALAYFEKGIEVEPMFASNYYWAAKLYCNSDAPMWGLLYGELFMNIERNTKRTEEISKLLFDTYKSQITFPESGKVSVNFSKQALIDPTKPAALPYSMIYEPTMGVAAATETAIDLASLDRIRQNFLKFYFDRGFNIKYPNTLFNYQQQINQSGNMEAYNHWLLLKGDEPAFNAWRAANQSKWDAFLKWFTANPLKMDSTNHFYRLQY
jgi:tetratricopeptide (TPR) repeat protein